MQPMAELNELYQQTILRHSRHPENHRALPDANRAAEGDNPLCGDHYTVFLKLEPDHTLTERRALLGLQILEITFQGAGCAVSKAAASLMTSRLHGKSVAEAEHLAAQFQTMVRTGQPSDAMGDLNALAGVHKFPMRMKCALLPWEAMLAALHGKNKTVSTQELT